MESRENDLGEIIESTLNFGREYKSSQYKKIDQRESKYTDFTHCSHVMIYAKTSSVFENLELKAIILMQMRNDGYIGFPGGIVEKGETPVEAACRELKEELNWSEDKGAITNADYMFSHVNEKKKLVLHFFATEITEIKMKQIESNMTKASHYGNEVFGNFRIPLFVMGDAFRGFPSFLKNHFIGNSKLQLIESLINLKLLSKEKIIQALHSAPLIA